MQLSLRVAVGVLGGLASLVLVSLVMLSRHTGAMGHSVGLSGEPREDRETAEPNVLQRAAVGRSSARPVADESGAGRDALSAAPPTALIRGRAVDARTYEPLCALFLIVGDSEQRECTTTAEGGGRFVTKGGYDLGDVSMRAFDSGSGEVLGEDLSQRRFVAGEWTFCFQVGPTFTLEAADPIDSRARSGMGRLVGVSPGGGAYMTAWCELRSEDGATWSLRFPPVFEDVFVYHSLEVCLTSDPQLASRVSRTTVSACGRDVARPRVEPLAYLGRAPIQTAVGQQAGVLAVDFEVLPITVGRVVDATGNPLRYPKVTVEPLEFRDPGQVTPDGLPCTWKGEANADGSLLVFPLARGGYRLRAVSADGAAMTERTFEIASKNVDLGDIRL